MAAKLTRLQTTGWTTAFGSATRRQKTSARFETPSAKKGELHYYASNNQFA
jgi:hypothetical protein